MKNIKGVIFDVDGTLMDPANNRISDSTINAIDQLHRKGIDVIIATGRNHFALGYQLDALKPDYVISCCGALVYDFKTNHQLTFHPMRLNDVNQLISISNQHNLALLFKFDDGMYLYNNWQAIPWINPEFNKTIDTDVYKFGITDRHFSGNLPLTAMIYCNPEIISQLKKVTNLQYIPAGVEGYDTVPIGINKGVGALDLFNTLGTHPDNYIVFGDHYNDMEIFQTLPYGIAMGNAVDELKKVAFDVTDAVDKDGIYNALKKYQIID